MKKEMSDRRRVDTPNASPPPPLPSGSEAGVIFGRNVVREALKAGSRNIHRLMIAKGVKSAHIRELVNLAKARGVPVQRVEKKVLARIVGPAKHQGIVALVASHPYEEEDEVLARLRSDSLLILLDEVEDPHNLGAIIRTAHCAGADAVVITKHRSAGLTHTVAKASAGAVEYIPVVRVTNLPSFIERLKEVGVRVIGVDPRGNRPYTAGVYRGPVALVFGSEGRGLRRLTRERCDDLVTIPMRGEIDSLNVSVAVGVVVFEVLRTRGDGS